MIDWGYLLHETEGHTPYGPEWFMLKPGRHHEGSGGKYRNILNGCYIEMYLTDERWEDEEQREALANQALICAAPELREEVIRLREIVKVVEDAVKTHIAWQAGASEARVVWDELAWELHDMLYEGEEE